MVRNLATSVTMRRDGVLPRGEWFRVENKKDEGPAQVYIYDEIGFWGTEASEFVKQLVDLDASDIDLHLNSPGGEIFDGLAIYNALKQNKANVTVYVDGLAASAASFIAQAGDRVVMARNAQMMIHDGIGFAYGNEADMRETADLLSKLSNNIADIYAQASGRRGFDTTLEDFRALMREEVWYNGTEAVEAGLADEVLDSDSEEAENTKNKWDLTFYNYAGRGRAESPSRVAARLLVANQKENNMPIPKGKPKNEGTETPAAPATEPDEQEPTTPAEEGTEEGTEEEAPEVAPVAPEEVPDVNPTASASTGYLVNGKRVTDPAAVQRHIVALETSQNEAIKANRNSFVDALAKEGRILASQIPAMQEHVQGLTPEQYASFEKLYNGMPGNSLFEDHASGTPTERTPADGGDDEIATLEAVVAQLNLLLPEEKVKESDPYLQLEALKNKS